jgi:hypothetical protein
LLSRIFRLLPYNEQHMTVALVSKRWHAWALQQRRGVPSFYPTRSQPLPWHAVQHAWRSPGLLTHSRQQAAVLALVAGTGDLLLLKWLWYQGCPWDEAACTAAAGDGRQRVLCWLRSKQPPCPWNEDACAAAARGGHTYLLEWLRTRDPPCPWDGRVQLLARDPDTRQWCEDNDAPGWTDAEEDAAMWEM